MTAKIAFAAGYNEKNPLNAAFEIEVIMTDGTTPTPQAVKTILDTIIRQINAGAYADEFVNATKPTIDELKEGWTKNPRAPKLTPTQRDEIARRAKNGASYAALAREFRVSASAIAYNARARGAKKRNQRTTTPS
ncbi:MAG: hypothetical protein [Circular genetic element sp.]|nr:MAG: hypothetical protein [Circular genetic element sp.]